MAGDPRAILDELIGAYDGRPGRWLRIEPHYVNGPAFGGLIGTARAFGAFLQDQLRPQSTLFDEPTRALSTSSRAPAPARRCR